MASRFASLSTAEIEEIEQKKNKENTKKVIKKAVKVFRSFLSEKNMPVEFEEYSTPDLDEALKSFYANARTEKGELYKVTSFNQIKYGITKYLKETHHIDISGEDFEKSQTTFLAVKKDLVVKGKGKVEHRPPVSKGDLQLLYDHPHIFNPDTPKGLQQKVLFELILYTCRRGRENLHDMTKKTYIVRKDHEGREYVEQAISELDKNHDENMSTDDTTGEGRIYDRPGSRMCPVASFKKYLTKLHPDLDSLWQRPAFSFVDGDSTWYFRMNVGATTLNMFMSNLSRSVKLSQIYTNHSIRATSIRLMDDAGFEARHIMRVTGHRYEYFQTRII